MLPSLTIAPIASALALKDLWTTLASTAPHSFVLSWHWIGRWLQCIGPSFSPMLLTVSANNAPVAIAIVINRTIWRRGILTVKTWTLNTTGHPDYDCISTEYDGLLARAGFADLAWSTVVGHFAKSDRE
jgi:hypothetical protein